MSHEESTNAQSMKELKWLAQFFETHGREDLAKKIYLDIEQIRNRGKSSKRNPSKGSNNVKPDSTDFASPN